ncbi:MAG: EF-hand domain-containing protein [Deltaproteobacteria bacterium]
MIKNIFMVITILLFAVSSASAADDAFSKLDKDKDGKISKQEYMDAAAGTFKTYDRNGDGILTREEIKAIKGIDVEKFLKETDANRDGKIVKEEFDKAAEKRFNAIDKNKNRYIDKNEWPSDRSEPYSPFTLFTY